MYSAFKVRHAIDLSEEVNWEFYDKYCLPCCVPLTFFVVVESVLEYIVCIKMRKLKHKTSGFENKVK